VETMENLVNEDVRAQLYTGGIEVPEDYQGLKRRLTAISRVMERKKLRAAQQSQMFWKPAQNSAPATKTSPGFGPAPNLAKQIPPSGTVPMDIDGAKQTVKPFLCYNCGKDGHMKQECPEPPKKKFNIWSIKTEDYSQEDLQALAATLREKGF
jgi:hypothetical protein